MHSLGIPCFSMSTAQSTTSFSTTSSTSSTSSPEPLPFGGVNDVAAVLPRSIVCRRRRETVRHNTYVVGLGFLGFSKRFPSRIPPQTATLRLAQTNLKRMDFAVLRKLTALEVLDISNNPLNPIPTSGAFLGTDFPLLRDLIMRQVDPGCTVRSLMFCLCLIY